MQRERERDESHGPGPLIAVDIFDVSSLMNYRAKSRAQRGVPVNRLSFPLLVYFLSPPSGPRFSALVTMSRERQISMTELNSSRTASSETRSPQRVLLV